MKPILTDLILPTELRFDLTYEELKQYPERQKKYAGTRFDLTYEELKHANGKRIGRLYLSFDLTYEELKLASTIR